MINKINNNNSEILDMLMHASISSGIRLLQSKIECNRSFTMEEFLIALGVNIIGMSTGNLLNITNEIQINNNKNSCDKKKLGEFYTQNFIDGVNHNSKLKKGVNVR